MKFLNKIFLMAMLSIVLVGCKDNEEYFDFDTADVDFVYSVAANEDGSVMYPLDFYVVSNIQFTNTSAKSGAVSWDFGDGQTSTEANPTHLYAASGMYDVTLTVDGVGKISYPLMINDIATVPSVAAQSDEIVVINDVAVELGLFLPNPEGLNTQFTLSLPEGTMDADGNELTEDVVIESTADGLYVDAEKLKFKFKHIGSQKINITTQFDCDGAGSRALAPTAINVQVGCNYECPTVYYAVKDGNIKAMKLVEADKVPAGTKVTPFDMGVGSGSMAQQIIFVSKDGVDEEGNAVANDELYILDCGKQYTYINDEDGVLGDGKINVMSADGTNVNTMVTNVGQTAFYDPFQGFSDGEYLYYTDRNTGIKKRPLSDRGMSEVTSYTDAMYMVTNDRLGYYNKSFGYGTIHSDIYVDKNGMFWWSKNFGGNGIYRFKESDIDQTNAEPYSVVLASSQPKAFTMDEERGHMYVWMVGGPTGAGFTQFPIPADTEGCDVKAKTYYQEMYADPINASASEGVYVSELAVDERNGNVYFGFRPAKEEEKFTANGLYYYDYNAKAIKSVEGVTDPILGVAINPRATKLF